MRLKSLLIAGAAAFAIVTGPALAQDSTTRYQQWQGYNSEKMQDLINQLDELIDQQEIVVKSLSGYLGRARGIAGATILGDGEVALILDVPTLIKGALAPSVAGKEAERNAA